MHLTRLKKIVLFCIMVKSNFSFVMLSKRGIFLVLLILAINFIIHLKILAPFYFLTAITPALVWAVTTVRRTRIDFMAIILCGIIQDLFGGNYSMITSLTYLGLIALRFFKHSFLLTEGKIVSILYYGVVLFIMLIFRDLFLSQLQGQTFYLLESMKFAIAGTIIFVILYLFLIYKHR